MQRSLRAGIQAKEQRHQEVGAGLGNPRSIQPALARRLKVGHQHAVMWGTALPLNQQIRIGAARFGNPANQPPAGPIGVCPK